MGVAVGCWGSIQQVGYIIPQAFALQAHATLSGGMYLLYVCM